MEQSQVNAPSFRKVPVLGIRYRSMGDQLAFKCLAPGDGVEARREPHNPYDCNAIKVLVGMALVGYINRQDAAQIAPWMDAGVAYRTVVDKVKSNYLVVTLTPIRQQEQEKEVQREAVLQQ